MCPKMLICAPVACAGLFLFRIRKCPESQPCRIVAGSITSRRLSFIPSYYLTLIFVEARWPDRRWAFHFWALATPLRIPSVLIPRPLGCIMPPTRSSLKVPLYLRIEQDYPPSKQRFSGQHLRGLLFSITL
jgi:hypothetical protein